MISETRLFNEINNMNCEYDNYVKVDIINMADAIKEMISQTDYMEYRKIILATHNMDQMYNILNLKDSNGNNCGSSTIVDYIKKDGTHEIIKMVGEKPHFGHTAGPISKLIDLYYSTSTYKTITKESKFSYIFECDAIHTIDHITYHGIYNATIRLKKLLEHIKDFIKNDSEAFLKQIAEYFNKFHEACVICEQEMDKEFNKLFEDQNKPTFLELNISVDCVERKLKMGGSK